MQSLLVDLFGDNDDKKKKKFNITKAYKGGLVFRCALGLVLLNK